MTLNDIRIHFFLGSRGFNNMSFPQQVIVLVRALDYLPLVARQDAAIYYGKTNPDEISQKQIYEYLCTIRDYDASEMSRIINAFSEELKKDERQV